MTPQKTLISGAGLVGSLWSILMARKNDEVTVIERRSDLRKAGAEAGRSINLALSDRGWRSLELAGVSEAVREISIPMYGRMIHNESGETKLLPYGKKDQAIWSVSRSDLNGILLNEAEKQPNVSLYFQYRTQRADFANKQLRVVNEADGNKTTLPYDRLYGTDGAFSIVRENMMKNGRFNYCQEFIEHGYKELSIRPNEDGKWKMDHNCLHIWPRKSFMLIALPNLDGSFTVTLFLAFEGKDAAFAKLNTPEKVRAFFNRYFSDASALMPHLETEFAENPASSLVTVRCSPWNVDGQTLLLGDAAHAIVPFFGQGMNAGFEDCTLLYQLMEEHKGDYESLFNTFSRRRKPDGDAIADLALDNFVEMRDKVADERFLLKKDLEKKIVSLVPEKWMPLYSMVTFSHMPYSEAQKTGKKQDEILENLIDRKDRAKLFDDGDYLAGVLAEMNM